MKRTEPGQVVGAPRFYVGVDVGTGSARAAVFDAAGRRLGLGVHPILVARPREDFVEHDSEDVWAACARAVRDALVESRVRPEDVRGVGFDATCSLVALGANDEQVTVSPTGEDRWNVIVWMDHRAMEETARLNATRHEVLSYVGGEISPEMQSPKLAWLKAHLPASWQRARRFLDLPDFLVYRATGDDVRSLCSTTCKWTYVGARGGWDPTWWRAAGLEDLAEDGFARIGARVRPMGEAAGRGLTLAAARDFGLREGTAVGVSIIDAHAGGLGVLGTSVKGVVPSEQTLEERLALIGGTSSCHMAVSKDARFIRGVWGPYQDAMVPGMWLSEGGQSATGALLDHTIFAHARGAELAAQASRDGVHPYALLNARLEAMAAETKAGSVAALARELHVLPDHHGNRSPRADPLARGMVCGLKLDDGLDHLARLYLATLQGIAHGTRHIVAAMNAAGYRITTLLATGGDAKNALFLREHADVTGCRVVVPHEPESVLLGAAILGATAAGDYPTVLAAMGAMSGAGTVIEPELRGPVHDLHEAKHRVFLRMIDDQLAYREIMK